MTATMDQLPRTDDPPSRLAAPERRRPRGSMAPRLFLAPTLVAMAVFFLWPLLEAARLSFTDADTGGFTLDNYTSAFTDARFRASLLVSVKYTALVVAGSLVAGMAAALLLKRDRRGRGVLRALFIMPWAMPFVTTALIWRWMLDSQYGVTTYFLARLGVEFDNPFSSDWTLLTVSIIEIWKTFPLAMMMLLAGMQAIPKDLYEAGALDGAGAWSRFRNITLPGLRATTAALTLLLILWIFGRAFIVIFLTTGGGPAGATETLVLLTYQTGFQQFELHRAAALGIVVLAIASLLTLIYLRVSHDRD